MKQVSHIEKNASTEERIKEAARKVFTEKGYAATRTRDIAEESGLNLALINYYFRSKENLFNIIMVENLQLFVGSILPILNDRSTSLYEKVEQLADHYIDMLIANPNIPVFMVNVVSNNPTELMNKLGGPTLRGTTYIEVQFAELMSKKKNVAYSPMHLFMNMVSLTVFPFIAAPLIKAKNSLSQEEYVKLMMERKKLIPVWVKNMFESI